MEEEINKKEVFANLRPVIVFAPELWGEVEIFRKFYNTTYTLGKNAMSALYGVHGHFSRYHVLLALSKRLIPDLKKEYEEIIETGTYDAIRSKELAAIIDSMFCELYSSVDCTCRIIIYIYGRYPGIGIDRNSISGLFKNAVEHKIDDRVPLEIRNALEYGSHNWFQRLRKIRDAINHSSVGDCSDLEGKMKGELEPKISYSHLSLANKFGNTHVTDDVFKMLKDFEVNVNLFQGAVYHALNQTLEDKETTQVCGWFGGRVHLRTVSPKEAIDFNSGKCFSRIYFDNGDMPTCPFVNVCGAYVKSENMDC